VTVTDLHEIRFLAESYPKKVAKTLDHKGPGNYHTTCILVPRVKYGDIKCTLRNENMRQQNTTAQRDPGVLM